MWTSWDKVRKFEELKGLTLSSVERVAGDDGDELLFTSTDGKQFKMFHEQDCCESVGIKDITGQLVDLIDSEILMAEESSNSGGETDDGSSTWTFYKLGTQRGYVTISWLGYSNGYYSEGVTFCEL